MKVKLNVTLKFDEHLIPGGTILIDDGIPKVILDLVEQNSPHVTVISASAVEMNAKVIDHDELDKIIDDPDETNNDIDVPDEIIVDDKEPAPAPVVDTKLKRRNK